MAAPKIALAKSLWPGKQAEFENHFAEMAGMDTIHDFWQGARSEGDPTPDDVLERLHSQIDGILTASAAGRRDAFMTGVAHGSGGWEPKMVTRFEESKIPKYLFGPSRTQVTYDEIIAGQHDRLVTQFGVGGNILDIREGTTPFKQLSTDQRNRVGKFVLDYFYPGQPANNGASFGVTFDALQGVVRDIFDGIGVSNQLYPQSVADSASTNWEAMSRPTKYRFPAEASVAKSNIFTSETVEFKFINNGFCKQNRAGFGLKVTNNESGESAVLKYIKTKPDGDIVELTGPSVNYLVTSITRDVTSADTARDKHGNTPRIPSIKPVLDLFNDNPDIQKRILLDFKRLGDYEQVAASTTDPTVIMSTGDHMCSLYARLHRKSCIFAAPGTHNMVLFRFSTRAPSPEEQVFQFHMSFAQENLARIGAINKVLTSQEDLTKVIADFTAGSGGYYLSDPSPKSGPTTIAAIDRGVESPEAYQDQQKQLQIANALTTYVMRMRMADALQQVEALRTGLQTAVQSLGDYTPFVPAFEDLSRLEVAPAVAAPWRIEGTKLFWNSVDLTDAVKRFEDAFTQAQGLIDFQLSNRGIFTSPLFAGNLFKAGSSNPTFDIARSQFDQFNKAFRELVGVINPSDAATARISERNRPTIEKKRLESANEALGKFFTKRDALIATFSTEAAKTNLETLVNIPNGLSVQDMRTAVLTMVGNVFAAAPRPSAPAVGGGDWNAIGGVRADFAQFLDLSSLFREVCGAAAAHVNALMTKSILDSNPSIVIGNIDPTVDLMQSESRALLAFRFGVINKPSTLEAMREISEHWQQGLLEIQENALDMYGVEYQSSGTDRLLNMLFSYKTLPNGEREFDPYISRYIGASSNADDVGTVEETMRGGETLSERLAKSKAAYKSTGGPAIQDRRDMDAKNRQVQREKGLQKRRAGPDLIPSFVNNIMLVGMPPEVKLMILLAVFDNELKSNDGSGKYFADVHPWSAELAPALPLKIGAKTEWDNLATYIQSGLQIIDPIPVGGNKRTLRQKKKNRKTWRR